MKEIEDKKKNLIKTVRRAAKLYKYENDEHVSPRTVTFKQ